MLIYLLAAPGDAGVVFGHVVVIVCFQAFVVVLACLSIAAIGSGGGDEPGSDGDGPGWHRPEPRQPPPEPHLSWPDFERQFAEHVAALRARDKVPSA